MAGTGRNRGLVRQWRLVQALQSARRGLTFAELCAIADDDSCERTIRRDIDTLTCAGFPVDVETGGPWQPTRVFWREVVN